MFPHPNKPKLGDVFHYKPIGFLMFNQECADSWAYDGYVMLSYNGDVFHMLRSDITYVTNLQHT